MDGNGIKELQGYAVASNLALIGLVTCLDTAGIFDGGILAGVMRDAAEKTDNPYTKQAFLDLADGFERKPGPHSPPWLRGVITGDKEDDENS